jgi:hypothetical protein
MQRELGEISERAGQPVDLVNQHNVDSARPDIGQELLQRRAVERGTGECAVVVRPGISRQPSCAWLFIYASQASRWASSELKASSRLYSVDLRV